MKALGPNLFWQRIPRGAGRVSRTLGIALSDSAPFAVSDRAATVAPMAAIVLGLLVGGLHPGVIVTSSLALLLVCAAVSGLGSGIGTYFWFGLVVGDALFADRSPLNVFRYAPSWIDLVVRGWLPLALTYLALAGLLVLGPLLGSAAENSMRRWRSRHDSAPGARSQLAQLAPGISRVLVQACYAFLWAEAAAFLIRPLWTYDNQFPDTNSIAPLQQGAAAIAVVVAVFAGIRVALVIGRPGPARGRLAPVGPGASRLPVWARIAGQSIMLALLLSGLTDGYVETGLLLVVLAAIATLRLVVLPHLPGYTDAVGRVPVAARVAAILVLSYFLGQLITDTRQSSFLTMLIALAISLLFSALLLPGGTRDGRVAARERK